MISNGLSFLSEKSTLWIKIAQPFKKIIFVYASPRTHFETKRFDKKFLRQQSEYNRYFDYARYDFWSSRTLPLPFGSQSLS